ncbi:MAG: VIT1/CCC1 transporter family protein [Candidatus Saccharimonadales bacterium]
MTKEELMYQDSALLAKRALQIQRGAARAAVLGVNDGLVSTLCIVLGVAAASGSQHTVLIAGFAGLVAGAISMAAGEWISVTSQVDLFKGVLGDLRHMVKHDRELLSKQLQDDFENSGLDPKTAKVAATEIARDDEHLSAEYARNVMGINPEELGSPWVAAFSSFALFTIGSLVALAPWFFTASGKAIALSIIFTSIGGLLVGGYVSRTSGKSIPNGAIRQLFIIAVASVVTYGVGYLFGTVVN